MPLLDKLGGIVHKKLKLFRELQIGQIFEITESIAPYGPIDFQGRLFVKTANSDTDPNSVRYGGTETFYIDPYTPIVGGLVIHGQ